MLMAESRAAELNCINADVSNLLEAWRIDVELPLGIMLRVFAESNKAERLRSMCPTGFRDSGNSVVNGFQPACFLPAITINEFLTLPICLA